MQRRSGSQKIPKSRLLVLPRAQYVTPDWTGFQPYICLYMGSWHQTLKLTTTSRYYYLIMYGFLAYILFELLGDDHGF
ncbi:hypothetical protein Hdeb2414_s0200g00830921 [Helianthus debilis subsp. tardiflorus]